jgi:hypothetical protein
VVVSADWRGAPLPPPVNRLDHRVGQSLEQEDASVEQRPREAHDEVRDDHGDDKAREHIAQIMRANEYAAGGDQNRDRDKEPADPTVDEVDAEGEPEGRAGVVARERRIV